MSDGVTDRLHTMLITDGVGDVDRLRWLLPAVLAGGVSCVQLREPALGARQLAALCAGVRAEFCQHDALLFVNDRADVAAAGYADGVHLGGHSLVPGDVWPGDHHRVLRGCSVHDAADIGRSVAADYLLLSPLFVTSCKPGATPLGPARARQLIAGTELPVVLLGGIGPANAAAARRLGAVGIAVRSALCEADDPTAVAQQLVATRDLALR